MTVSHRGKSYVLARLVLNTVSEPCWLEYLAYSGVFTTNDYREAKLFPTREEATNAIPETRECCRFGVITLWDMETITTLRYQVFQKARGLFGLKGNSPYWLVADRYEEEGMLEEAELLRVKLR